MAGTLPWRTGLVVGDPAAIAARALSLADTGGTRAASASGYGYGGQRVAGDRCRDRPPTRRGSNRQHGARA